MSATLAQIFALNPTTTIGNNDLLYLVQSPYTPGSDAGILGSDLKALFVSSTAIIDVAHGGTGSASFTPHTVIIAGANPTDPLTNVAGTGLLGQVLTSLGPLNPPFWANNPASGTVNPGLANEIGYYAAPGSAISPISPTQTNGLLVTSNVGVPSILAGPGTTGNILQSNAASPPSFSTATYPSTANNAARILRSDGTNWVESTSTFADIYAASSILFANGANNVGSIPTANNGLLVTSNTGIPSILAGPGVTGQILQSNAAAAPSFSTATFPSIGGPAGNILISDGTNYIASTSLWPNTVGSAGKIVVSDGTANVYSTPTFPNASALAGKVIISDGTNWIASTSIYPNTVGATGKIIISDGSSNVYSTPTYPNSATGTGTILRANGTNWVATTSTFADTYAINTILYNATANTVTGLASAASSVLVTSAGSVPSWSTTLPAFTTSSITFNPTTGGIVGTTTNNNADAGKVGEVISSVVLFSGSPVAITSTVAANLTSISLTAGDWDVLGNVSVIFAGTGTVLIGWTSTTSATVPDRALRNSLVGISAASTTVGINVPYARYSLAATTTVYISLTATFTSTATAVGGIYARRAR